MQTTVSSAIATLYIYEARPVKAQSSDHSSPRSSWYVFYQWEGGSQMKISGKGCPGSFQILFHPVRKDSACKKETG